MTDADRATLANVLRELEEIDAVIQRKLTHASEYQTHRDVLMAIQMRSWYCEGRIRGLLAEPIATSDRGKE